MTDLLIVFGATYLFAASFLLVIAAWIMRDKAKQKPQWTAFALTIILTGLFGMIGNHAYSHDRPFVVDGIAPLVAHAADNGFPSDHTLLTAAIAAGLWGVSRRLSLAAWVVAILVGVARVMAHVHWPMDILASLAFALVAGLIANAIARTCVRT